MLCKDVPNEDAARVLAGMPAGLLRLKACQPMRTGVSDVNRGSDVDPLVRAHPNHKP